MVSQIEAKDRVVGFQRYICQAYHCKESIARSQIHARNRVGISHRYMPGIKC